MALIRPFQSLLSYTVQVRALILRSFLSDEAQTTGEEAEAVLGAMLYKFFDV